MASPEELLNLVDDKKETAETPSASPTKPETTPSSVTEPEETKEKKSKQKDAKVKKLEENIDALKNELAATQQNHSILQQQLNNVHAKINEKKNVETKKNKSFKEFLSGNKKILLIIVVLIAIAIIATIIVNKTSLFAAKPDQPNPEVDEQE